MLPLDGLYFQYVDMNVTSVWPSFGPASGGTHLTVTGDNFVLDASHGEEGLEEHTKFVGSLLIGGRDAPVGDHLRGVAFGGKFVEPENSVGVSYIECQ